MKHYAAWLLFLLACVLPSWYLRDIVAAEGQLRLQEPPIRGEWERWPIPSWNASAFAARPTYERWIPSWRALGQRGQEHLWETWIAFKPAARGEKAWKLLKAYENPTLFRLFCASLATSDDRQVKGAWNWIHDRRHSADPSSCASRMGDEDLLRILLAPRQPRLTAWLARELWVGERETGARVVTRWLRETRDAQAIFWVLYANPLPGRVDASTPEGRTAEAHVRVLLSTGLENPDPEVREVCNRLLEWMRLGLGEYRLAR